MKLLVVEDDQTMQDLTRLILEKEGYQVHAAASAAQALQSVQDVHPDLVLLDIGLPDESGYSVCRRIRAKTGGIVPILFLTTRGDIRSRLEGFSSGAQDYIQKPFSPEELVARVAVHLQSKKSLEDLARKNYELQLRERVQRDTTDMIVHDLKAPLSSIKATLEIIKAQGMINDVQYRRLIDISESATSMLLLMINDILDIAHSEKSDLPVDTAPVDLNALLEKLKALFESMSQLRKIRLETRVRSGRVTVHSDRQLLFRILVNLVSNALKFSSEGGEVLVECAPQGKALRLTVSDRGPGVPDKEKQRIFEKFAQLSEKPVANLERGSGIGLAFCRIAAQALEGRIWVEDREGGGSCFILELP